MAERMLIVKVKRTTATQAELYGARHKYPDLRLFDLGELAAVGLDPASLPIGQETPARFYAHYELSDKLNQKGNPYKDVVALESVGAPSTVASTDNSAILAELRAIRALLAVMAQAQGLEVPELPDLDAGDNGDGEPSELDAAFPRYGDGSTLSDNAAEREAYAAHLDATGKAPTDRAALRSWYAARHNGGNGK